MGQTPRRLPYTFLTGKDVETRHDNPTKGLGVALNAPVEEETVEEGAAPELPTDDDE